MSLLSTAVTPEAANGLVAAVVGDFVRLNYLEKYYAHKDGFSPAAESVVNCMGAIANMPDVVQNFYMAGLPVWFLGPSTVWDSAVRCDLLETVISRCCRSLMCFGTLPARPCNFLWLCDRLLILFSFTEVVCIQRSIWGSGGLVDPTLAQPPSHCLQRSTSSTISASSSQFTSSSQSAPAIQPTDRHPEHSRAPAGGSSRSPSYIYSSMLLTVYPQHHLRPEAPNFTT